MQEKILVLDDDPIILDSLRIMLEMHHYEVKCILNPEFLMTSLEEFNPDLLLMDISLGTADGRALCDELKADENVKQIPIVLISALTYSEIAEIESCADAVLGKPFDVDNILRTIQNLLYPEIIG